MRVSIIKSASNLDNASTGATLAMTLDRTDHQSC